MKTIQTLMLSIFMLSVPFATGITFPTADFGAIDPTSTGQAIIGFEAGQLPDVKVGSNYAGFPVLNIVERGNFIVLAADDLLDVRLATFGMTGIAYVEDDVLKTVRVIPNDSRYSQQYGPRIHGLETAWDDIGFGSSDVIVAVLDTGIRRTHQDFESSRILPGYDYSNNDSNPADDCDHGTHVSGTVGATTNNGVGVAGMSQTTILPMKVLSPIGFAFVTCGGNASDIADAIYDSTDQGADVITMSLGGSGSTTERNAVDYAWNNGVVVLAASGNDGGDNSVDCPACYDSVIAVGSVTSSKARSSFSDGGPQLEIMGAGSGIWSTTDNSDSSYQSMDGTSMATPHVAGIVALAKGCSGASNVEIRQALQNTAEDLGAAGRDNAYGHGLARADLLINELGCGVGRPTAAFSASVSDLTISVDGSASSDPEGDSLSYSWNFGDGATGSGVTASHTYGASGTYTVTLTVSDGTHSDTESRSYTVTDGSAPVDPDPSTPNLESGVTQSISVSAGSNAHYKIHVPGDATSLTVATDGPNCTAIVCSVDADLYTRFSARPTDDTYDCRPYASGSDETCTHSNAAEGWWYVRVYGYSGSGTVTITATHDGSTGPNNNAPTASFTSSCTDLACSFDGSGSSDPDGDSLTYSWVFGDGASATGATPSHTYSSTGSYTVTLTVNDGNGGSDASSQTVTVSAPNNSPTASFTASTSDRTVDVDGTASSDPDGDSLSYSWDFGDGNTGSGATASHTYAADGTYTITLTVDDGNGGTDSTSTTVSVSGPADPDPQTQTLQNGETASATLSGAGDFKRYKIYVPAGASSFQVVMDGPDCSVVCTFDADLYVRYGERATQTYYDCRPYEGDSDETCTFANPTPGWYYIRAQSYQGSGTVSITASY